MIRTPLKKVGKIGKVNSHANREIAKMWIDHDINYCEVCPILSEMGLLRWNCLRSGTNAHRHSRIWYRKCPELLYNYVQVLFACVLAHMFMDNNPDIKELVFARLRGAENE